MLTPVATPPTCEADSCFQSRWRISRERHLRKTAGRDAYAQDRARIHLRQALGKGHHCAQIFRTCLAGFLKASTVTAATIGRILFPPERPYPFAQLRLPHSRGARTIARQGPAPMG